MKKWGLLWRDQLHSVLRNLPLPTLSKTRCLPVLFPSWRNVQGVGWRLEGLGEKAGTVGSLGNWERLEGPGRDDKGQWISVGRAVTAGKAPEIRV